MQQFTLFLGQIGIDVNLLIAQIVNFALLLWILNRFIYKSMVKRIEDDENELHKAKILQDSLAAERNKFLKQKEDELSKAKKLSRKKIMEAGELAEEIKKQAKASSQKEMAAMVDQMKKQLSSRQANLKNEQLQNMKGQILKNVTEITKKLSGASDSIALELQDFFLSDLPGRLDGFPKGTFQNPDPKIILETAHPLSGEQHDRFLQAIEKKFTRPVETTEKTNPELIGGYRLEISGVAIENNLLNELLHATETV